MTTNVYDVAEVDELLGSMSDGIVSLGSGLTAEAAVRAEQIADEADARAALAARVATLEQALPPAPTTVTGGLLRPTGDATKDTAAIKAALLGNGADLGPGRFKVNEMLSPRSVTAIRGMGAGVTVIDYVGPTAPAAIRGAGMGLTGTDDHQHLTGFSVEAHGQVDDLIALQPAYLHLDDVWAISGHKRSGLRLDTQTVGGEGAVHNRVTNTRFKSKAGWAFDNVGGMTDFVYDEIVYLKPDGANAGVGDFHATNAGGGFLGKQHTNGSAGSCIVIDRAMALDIDSEYLDGFGCHPITGQTYYAIEIKQLASGDGGSGVNIRGLRNRHRPKLNSNAATYVDLRVGGGTAGVVTIDNVITWVRAANDAGEIIVPSEHYVMQLDPLHAYTMTNINPIMTNMLGGLYRGAAPTKRIVSASIAGV